MNTITIVFTKSIFSPISWLVRLLDPTNPFRLTQSSHCFIRINNSQIVYDAYFTTGVRKLSIDTALKGSTIVKIVTYIVPNIKSAISFLENQLGKKYDLLGSTKLIKSRDWEYDSSWYCYRLAASVLRASGLNIFHELDYINEKPLMNLAI